MCRVDRGLSFAIDFEGEIVTTRKAEHTEIYLESASTINAGVGLGVFVRRMRKRLEQAVRTPVTGTRERPGRVSNLSCLLISSN